MASAETLEAMRLYETIVWPTAEHAERHYRRTDVLFLTSALFGLTFIITGVGLLPTGWKEGVLTGLVVPLSLWTGVVYQRILNRRMAFKKMREMHEQAMLTLSYEDDG